MEIPRKIFSSIKEILTKRSVIIVLLSLLCFVAIYLFSLHQTEPQTYNSSFIAANGTEFKFPCVISDMDAISSIERADSDQCKIVIGNAACKSAYGRLFPSSIEHRCPSGKYAPYRSVGCFPFSSSLFAPFHEETVTNTPKNCVDMCMMIGFRYAGVVNGNLCYCGDVEPNMSQVEKDSTCNIPCSGNGRETCGGKLLVYIYETGLAKHQMTPIKLSPRSEEKPARIAFLLMCYKRNLRQIHRLLGAIYDPQHYYYIHVDARQDYLFREMIKLEKNFSNIYIARQRHIPVWGCDSLLQLVLGCFENILAMPSWQPDFIINMSESDFPVKSVSKLTNFLTANKGRNFLEKQKVFAAQKYISSTGLNKNFVECSGRMWGIGERSLPVGITYQGGSDWFCLSKQFAQYVVNTNEELVGDLRALAKYTGFGTETFFHTLLYNSRFCQTHYDSNLRLISWNMGHGCNEKSQTIDFGGCSPLSIRDENWSELMLMATDDILLARKFNPIFDQTILLKLEEKMLGKYPPNTPNLNSYWENVYHHDDHDTKNNTAALIRIAYTLVSSYGREHHFQPFEVLNIMEITHYFNRNMFSGFLIRFDALIADQILDLELLVKPRTAVKRRLEWELTEENKKDIDIYVTNNFDRAEKLPIDFDRVLTVDQAPFLIIHISADNPLPVIHTVRIDWINPRSEVASVEEFTITEHPLKSQNHPWKSSLLLPLDEGVWEVKVYLNDSVVGTVEFLTISSESVPACYTCTKCLLISITEIVANQCKVSERDLHFRRNPFSKATMERLYEIERACAVYEEPIEYNLGARLFENCYDTLWSSFAPDPKSDMHYLLERSRKST